MQDLTDKKIGTVNGYAYNRVLRNSNEEIFSTTRTEEREHLFKWVGPIATNTWTVFALKDRHIKIKSEEDLKAYKIGGYRQSATSSYLKNLGLPVSELESDETNPRRLVEGMIDLWASGNLVGMYRAKAKGYSELIELVYTLKDVDLYLALNKSFPDEVVAKLNLELNQMRDTGIIEEIMVTK